MITMTSDMRQVRIGALVSTASIGRHVAGPRVLVPQGTTLSSAGVGSNLRDRKVNGDVSVITTPELSVFLGYAPSPLSGARAWRPPV